MKKTWLSNIHFVFIICSFAYQLFIPNMMHASSVFIYNVAQGSISIGGYDTYINHEYTTNYIYTQPHIYQSIVYSVQIGEITPIIITRMPLNSIVGGNGGALDAACATAPLGSSTSRFFNTLYTSNDREQIQSSVQQAAGEAPINSACLVSGQAQAFHGAIGKQQANIGTSPHALDSGLTSGLWSTAEQSNLGADTDHPDNGLLQTLVQIMAMNTPKHNQQQLDGVELRAQAHWLHQGAHGGRSGYNAETGLAALGYDTSIAENARIGFAAGFSLGQLRGTGATTDVKSWSFGPYTTWRIDPITLDADLTYTYSRGKVSGSYIFPVQDSTTGRFGAHTISGNLKVSHSFGFSNDTLRIIPSIGIESSTTIRDAFSETGASITRHYAADTMCSVGMPVGTALQMDFLLGDTTVTPQLSAYYVRELADTAPSARVTLLDSTTPFTTNGADAGRNLLRTGFGVNSDFGSGVAVSTSYVGEFGDRYSDNGVELQLKYTF